MKDSSEMYVCGSTYFFHHWRQCADLQDTDMHTQTLPHHYRDTDRQTDRQTSLQHFIDNGADYTMGQKFPILSSFITLSYLNNFCNVS